MGAPLSETIVIDFILQAIFPEFCLHCGERVRQNAMLCTRCASGEILKRPVGVAKANGIEQKFSFLYEGAAKTLFSAAKFSERQRPLKYFIEAARPDLVEMLTEKTIFLAVPSRRKFLARLLGAILPPGTLVLDAFRFEKEGKNSAANKLLGEAGRYRRIHESLTWNNANLRPAEKYIVCDDVSTTGATLSHAAHLVQQHLDIDKSNITLWALMYRERQFRIPRQ